ncbi:hypothetical protein F0919_04130 [Taibaiella lutea]|uniref:Uncharacterized protein n=1 Tax=Taibaiella lutea TaxID=2608001 RepID=A0A5M6CNR9_9BACT|nr:hypothetical protein [Taibaiella lutea]KAA5536868.1 hypothetical protein F0919_04130 [Taibaiella lutea]
MKFKNDCPEKFMNLQVNVLGEKFQFENLESGESTKFIKVSKTYSYCFIRAITPKDTIAFLPIDYYGERLYTTGKIVMKITMEKGEGGIKRLNIKSKRPML